MALSLVIGGSGSGTKVAVPNVVEQPQAQAEATLKALEFKVVSAPIVVQGTEGTVFSQEPPGNTVANRKSTVKLFIVQNPVIPVDIGQTLTEIQDEVALVEKDTAAEARKNEVLAKIAEVETEANANTRNLAVVAKLDAIEAKLDSVETKVGLSETDTAAQTRNQAVLDKLDTLETDDVASDRNQLVLDKLDTLELDDDAEQRKQEILEKIEEYGHKGDVAAARKSSTTRKA
jgi:beta-lactam-binding protein with PASTA domain